MSEQLKRLRDEINGLSSQLVEEVPSEIEDVDTAFDDESKRWFARELYSLKLECEKGKSFTVNPSRFTSKIGSRLIEEGAGPRGGDKLIIYLGINLKRMT